MSTVLVELSARPTELTEITFIDDLDDVLESNKCSCNAGDDNPY